MTYSYYDYAEKYWEDYYDYYYEYYYWPYYYGNYNGSNTTWYNGTYPPSKYAYSPPYNIDVINPLLFSLSVICAALSLCVAFMFFYQMCATKKLTDIISIIITSFCILCHLSFNISDLFSYYIWMFNWDWIIYDRSLIAYDTCWFLSKISLYAVFIHRYYLIVDASMTSLNNKIVKYIVFGAFIFVMFIQISLNIAFLLKKHHFHEKTWEDTQRIYLNISWAYLSIDLLLISLLGILILRTILELVVAIDRR